MLKLYRRLMILYPAAHREQFGDEMISVFNEMQSEARHKKMTERATFYIREASGLLAGALHEHLRIFNRSQKWLAFPTRRFTVRSEFRFPKATAVLMMIILAGIVMAIEKARTIQTSYSNGHPPVVPLEVAHLTFFPTVALWLVTFYAAGAVGWAILFVLHRSGVHRLADVAEQK
jgi:hypothetical protein